jgi:subtilisin family serine protease
MVATVLRPGIAFSTVILGLLLTASSAWAALDEAAAPAIPPTPPPTFSLDRVIVQWAPGADRRDRVEARAEADVAFAATLSNSDFQLVGVQPGQTAATAAAELEDDRSVLVAEPDSFSSPTALPDDPLLNQLWGLRNQGLGIDGFPGAVAGADVDAAGAWARTVGDPATVVADIDSGYRFEHPDLADVAWSNPGETSNGTDDDANGIVDDLHGADFVGADGESLSIDGNPTDDDLLSGGHGVHTAGTIGAEGDNGIGITGVAQDIRLMPLRVCSRFAATDNSRCPTSSIVAAINYAGSKGARVANMSLTSTSFSQAQVNAIAANPDVLFVISAGNDGVDNDSTPHYPCDFEPQLEASPPVPGAVDNIVCVAATDQADGLASFSDWGATSVDLGAPGTETLSTYPFVTPLEDTFTADDFVTKWPATGADGGFERSDEAPLSSFGMTDTAGDPVAETVRETTSAPVTVPANGGCRLNQTRRLVAPDSESFRYSVLLDGTEKAVAEPADTPGPGLERRFADLPPAFKAGGSVQVRFRFTTGATPAEESGVWLDDISLVCAQAVGQASAYAFLQGTSMAAPHVSGAAALLLSLEPAASVTELREALLAGVEPVPSLVGKSVTGGRLDIPSAIDALEAGPVDDQAPDAPLLTSTDPASPASEGNPRILGSAEADSTIDIYLGQNCEGSAAVSGTAGELASSGIAVSAPEDSVSQFSATATDVAENSSPCSAPISYTNSTKIIVIGPGEVIVGPLREPLPLITVAGAVVPQLVLPSCTVPKLAGKTLGQAKVTLAGAGCRVGKVSKPRARKGQRSPALVVRSSSPGAGSNAPGAVVALTLGPKPKKQHH